jgi:predicted nicotinamide N-methyase
VVDREECFEYVYGDETEQKSSSSSNSHTSNMPQVVNLRLYGWKRELGQQLDSTGLTMWRAGEDLGRYLWEKRTTLFGGGQQEMLQKHGGRHVLELGCGLGLCGLLASQLNPKGVVVLTDGDELTMEKLAVNVEENTVRNGCAVTARTLLWGDHRELVIEFPDLFDLVLAADVIYEEAAIVPLLQTVVATLKEGPESLFLLSFARRNVSVEKVLKAAREMGLVCEVDESFVCGATGEHVYIMRRAQQQQQQQQQNKQQQQQQNKQQKQLEQVKEKNEVVTGSANSGSINKKG